MTRPGVAAVSISSAVIYLDKERIQTLIPLVQEAARRISAELGWKGA
ncbi:IclR family transcriptional regulator C-terminal domain-containing protein [Thermus scotoductus]|nr:IclR family transcriptional regulator C-terminal domain-containing protein [Thermus scotoductus]